MSRRIALAATACVAAASLAVQAAGATPAAHTGPRVRHVPGTHHVAKKHAIARSTGMLVGINDEADALYGNPDQAFAALSALRVQVLRVNLYWGGNQWAVANQKPTDPTDPGDPAYKWGIYDRLARYAKTNHIQLMFSILFTPRWANGGQAKTVAPTSAQSLRDFAVAAATRYDGFYVPPSWQQQPSLEQPDEPLPVVNLWTAWNEPNNPIWLTPQYKRVGGKWQPWAAMQYAKICNAVYAGVHSVTIKPGGVTLTSGKYRPTKEQVACGVTDPRGNDNAGGSRASIDPLSFLTAAKKAGMGPFDAYAHNPYASAGNEAPSFVPSGNFARRIQLGNINVLLSLISKYYGPKHLWITEYGYQTNPPKTTIYGTSWKNQATYLRQAVLLARANPRIDMFIWYLVRDEPSLQGWQSGLMTANGQKKPSWNVFRGLPRG